MGTSKLQACVIFFFFLTLPPYGSSHLFSSPLWWQGIKWWHLSLLAFVAQWGKKMPSLQLVPLPPSRCAEGNWHDLCLYISVSSIWIYSIIFQKSVEHLVTCSRHLARVAPSSVSLYGKGGPPKEANWPPCEWRTAARKDELGFMNMDRIHSLFLISKITQVILKTQFMFVSLNHPHNIF